MASWQLQEAKAKFSEVIDTAEKKGPQIVTRHGVETAVILPISEWRRLSQPPIPVQKGKTEQEKRDEFLRFLRSAPDFEIPDRHRERLARRKAARVESSQKP